MFEKEKNGPIDYSKFFEEERKKPETKETFSSKKRNLF